MSLLAGGNDRCITRVTRQMWKWRTDLADMLHHLVIPGNQCWERWNEAFVTLGDHVNIPRCRFLLSSFYEHVCIMSLTLSSLIILHHLPSFDLSKVVSVKTETTCLINWSQQRDWLRVRLPSQQGWIVWSIFSLFSSWRLPGSLEALAWSS